MQLFKNKSVLLILVLVLFLAGFTSLYKFNQSKYVYVQPKRGDLVEAIYGLGKVKSNRKYEVRVGVMTKIAKLFVQEGQVVKQGDALIQFEDTKVFKAPFTGTVVSIPFNVPDIILPQVVTLTMLDLKDKYIEVSLEQEGALRVAREQKAKVLFESVRGEVFEAKVKSIYPKDDEFLAHIDVPELKENILPGMTADVSIIVGERKNVLLIPISGLTNGQLAIRRNGKKAKVKVQLGIVDGQWGEVVSGDILPSDEILLSRKSSELSQQGEGK